MPKAPAKKSQNVNLSKSEVIIITVCVAVISAVLAAVTTAFIITNQNSCEDDEAPLWHDDGEIELVKKPIMYFYPEHEMDLTVSFQNSNLLTHTYPKYSSAWNVHIDQSGNIYDYNTERNYYALYWEAKDETPADFATGFVVKGEETIAFLEEKLSLLGFNEREINEFVTYWINELEDNNYNYIHFRTTKEMNQYMPVNFSTEPDTLIRVVVDFAKLDEPITVESQQLESTTRTGFVVTEWGGRNVTEQLK